MDWTSVFVQKPSQFQVLGRCQDLGSWQAYNLTYKLDRDTHKVYQQKVQ